MMRPRNLRRHQPMGEALERRLALATSVGWDGPGQGSASLTYYIGNAPASLGPAEVETGIRTALDAWASVAAITFTRTAQPHRTRSLDFTFGRIDGPGGTLARAYYPDDVSPARLAGNIQFDASDRWEIGNSLGGAAFDLALTAVHEIGHALGLDHSTAPGSVMAESISANGSFTGLGSSDVQSIRALYASSEWSPAVPTGGPADPSGVVPPHVQDLSSVRSTGRGRTAVIVRFSGPMDPARVSDLGLYRLAAVGKGKTAHPTRVRLAAASYNTESHSVTLMLKKPFQSGRLQLTIDASAVIASNGVALAAGDYVAIVPR